MSTLLALHGITKHFGVARALDGASFELAPCEIHALLGENGAGKSTLIKVLAGLLRPDGGSIELDGRTLTPGSMRDAAAAGLRFVHQDLGLVDAMSVLDNIALEAGYVRNAVGLIDFPATAEAVRLRLARLGSTLPPDRPVAGLGVAEKTLVAMARALGTGARILVLDEVTASLPAPEVERLHAAIRAAREQGISVILVTHRLDEVFAVCDRLTVLADGRRVATAAVDEVDRDTVVRWIVGRAMTPPQPIAVADLADGSPSWRLAALGLLGQEVSVPLSFTVAPGEVVGITGLVGSGYETVASWLAGLQTPVAGSLSLDGRLLPLGAPPALRDAGFQVISGDRTLAAFADLTVRENLYARGRQGRGIGLAGERHQAGDLVRRFDVHPPGMAERPMSRLSGGNQQKVLFARAIASAPRAVLMIDPTAGVDIGARAELYQILRQQLKQGMAAVLASSDFEEIAALADRVWVLARGRAPVSLRRHELTPSRLVFEALGGQTRSARPFAEQWA